MSNRDETALVPKLRFPEFGDCGEWNIIKLIDVVDKKRKWSFSGGPFGSNLKSSDYTSNGIRVIQLQNIGDGKYINTNIIFTSKEKADELLSCNIYPDEIIMSKMGDPVGRACLIPNTHSRYLMCSDGIRVVVNEEFYSKYYIYSLINSNTFRSTIENNSTGSTRKRIGLDVLKNLPITVPRKDEQKKIADCLSSLDELITAEDKKLKALKIHKKGLIQSLFPAEGKTVPEWRFPEFKDSGEWEEKQVLEIGEIIGGGTPPKNEEAYWNGNIPWISSSDIAEGFIFNINKTRFITKEAISSSATKLCPSGTICIVSRVGVGKVALTNCDLCTSQDFTNITNITENLVFMTYLLSIKMITASQQTQGTSIKGITIGEIKNMKVFIPSIYEQQKIANSLSSVDELILAQAEKIETLKLHKKGLMQGLFIGGQEK